MNSGKELCSKLTASASICFLSQRWLDEPSCQFDRGHRLCRQWSEETLSNEMKRWWRDETGLDRGNYPLRTFMSLTVLVWFRGALLQILLDQESQSNTICQVMIGHSVLITKCWKEEHMVHQLSLHYIYVNEHTYLVPHFHTLKFIMRKVPMCHAVRMLFCLSREYYKDIIFHIWLKR